MELLLEVVRRYVDISAAEAQYFSSLFTHQRYKRNVKIMEAGTVAKQVFFVIRGGLRQYFTNEKGTVKTCNFCFEGEFLTDLESFSNKSPATTDIMTLEPTECLTATCTDLVACMAQSPALNSFFNSIVEEIAMANTRRVRSLLSESPEEQFEALLRSRSAILQRVPQRYIAEYLGVAPESLSRIRKRMWLAPKS